MHVVICNHANKISYSIFKIWKKYHSITTYCNRKLVFIVYYGEMSPKTTFAKHTDDLYMFSAFLTTNFILCVQNHCNNLTL